MLKNILLLEDDPQQRETFQTKLEGRYPGATVRCLDTEFEFYNLIGEIERGALDLPDVVIADDMVPWETVSRDQTPPPDSVKEGGYSRAGIRCLMQFRQRIDAPIPWIMFSILDPNTIMSEIIDVPYSDKITVMSKERHLRDLFVEIDRLVGGGRSET
jgi:hypothetical protein